MSYLSSILAILLVQYTSCMPILNLESMIYNVLQVSPDNQIETSSAAYKIVTTLNTHTASTRLEAETAFVVESLTSTAATSTADAFQTSDTSIDMFKEYEWLDNLLEYLWERCFRITALMYKKFVLKMEVGFLDILMLF
jgi:hypothetical protein